MFTLIPANFVPGLAAAADADGAVDGATTDGAVVAAGADVDGDGVAELLQAVTTRIVLIAAATIRYRDTAGSPPLDIRRRSSSILDGWRYAGQYAHGIDKVKIPHAVQPAGRSRPRDRVNETLRGALTMTDPARLADETSAEAESLAPAVTRAGAILDLLAENAGEAAGPSELARRLGLPKSSIANICNALADIGLVRRIGTGFALGRKLAELGGAYLASVDQVQEFYEATQLLPAGSEETVQLAILDGLEMTYLARHDGRQPVRLTSQIGRRLPATVTATGKAALASLAESDLEARLAGLVELPTLTPNSIASVDALRADLAIVRERGYSMDDEETVEGVVCFGVMIPGRRPGEGPYAASITLLKARATDERVPLLIDDLHRLADRLSDPLRADGAPRRVTLSQRP
jgi:DNA-binding IclR family transcriptional regulator